VPRRSRPQQHGARPCRELLESHPGPLTTTALVVAETGWLLDRQLGPDAETACYRSIATLDRRYFGVVRPSHAKALSLVP